LDLPCAQLTDEDCAPVDAVSVVDIGLDDCEVTAGEDALYAWAAGE
jgi:hypothetical protein